MITNELEKFNNASTRYERKAFCLSSGLCKDLNHAHKISYQHHVALKNGTLTDELQEEFEWTQAFIEDLKELSYELYDECRKTNHNIYSKRGRLKNKIETMLTLVPCSFLTLTFSTDILEKTSFETRATYVKRYLKSQCEAYVANVDFGGQNGREHYHAVIASQKVDIKEWAYGRINIRPVRYKTDIQKVTSPVRLAKYTNKLCNHALKETCKQNKTIYSRNFNDWVSQVSSCTITED